MFVTAGQLKAGPANFVIGAANGTGGTVITFSELGNLQNQTITTQFAPFGLTSISPGTWDSINNLG
jgi:hypothetical protein